jgi:O-antigen/teichoic acid export membrane protein
MSAAPHIQVPSGQRVARNVALLASGELVSRLIGFIATIYIARTLGAEAYGIIGFGLAILLYATTLADAGLEHTGPREVADTGGRLDVLVSSLLIARFLWATIIAAVVVLGATLFFSGVERSVLSLYGLALLPIGAYTRWLHVGLQRMGIVAAARVLPDVLRVAAILLLVRGPGSLIIVPLAEIGANLLTALILVWGMRAAGVRLHLHVDPALTRAVFTRAAPMGVSALLAVMIYNADLVFLRIFRDTAEVGLYLAGYTLINFLGILGHVVALTLLPVLTQLRGATDARNSLYLDSMARAFAAGLPMAVGGAMVAAPLILLVFGEAFGRAAPVLAILIWTLPVVLLRSVAQAALLADGRQDLVLRTTGLAAAANVTLNLIAVPAFGMLGAAMTTVVAETLRMGAVLNYARRIGLPYLPPRRLLRSAVAAAGMGVALLVTGYATLWAIPVGVVSYVAALFLTGGIRIRDGRPEVTV